MTEIRPGYKQTEVGVIPEDWKYVYLSDIADVKGGKRLPKGFSLQESPTPHPYIRVTDMNPGYVSLNNIQYVPIEAYQSIKNYRIYADEIFISVAGTLGIVGVIPTELDGANLTENADRITAIKCNRDYLMYWLMSDIVQQVIKSATTIGAQPKLALGRIKGFAIALPSSEGEQRAIAAALSDVDGLLTALAELIAKKRAIKQAAMQQLLTGQTRLPGFSGEWTVKRLEDIANLLKGQGLSKDKLSQDGAYKCILYGELFTTYGRIIDTVKSSTDYQEGVPSQSGDILMPGSTTTVGIDLAIASTISADNTRLGGDIIIIRLKDRSCDSKFLAYYLTEQARSQIAERAQGITIIHLYGKSLLDLEIRLPPSCSEQAAISEVLSLMEVEISALEAQHAKVQAIKQGMMQELLTGRTRLV